MFQGPFPLRSPKCNLGFSDMKFEQTQPQETKRDLTALLRSPEEEERIRKEIKTWPVYTLEARDGDKGFSFMETSTHTISLAYNG